MPAAGASSVYAFSTTLCPPESATRDRQMHQSRPQYMRGAGTGILIPIFALMIFVFLQNFRPGIGGSLIRLGKKTIPGNQAPPPSPGAAPPAPARPAPGARPLPPPAATGKTFI